jgi:hypothetical protein
MTTNWPMFDYEGYFWPPGASGRPVRAADDGEAIVVLRVGAAMIHHIVQ